MSVYFKHFSLFNLKINVGVGEVRGHRRRLHAARVELRAPLHGRTGKLYADTASDFSWFALLQTGFFWFIKKYLDMKVKAGKHVLFIVFNLKLTIHKSGCKEYSKCIDMKLDRYYLRIDKVINFSSSRYNSTLSTPCLSSLFWLRQ